MSRFSSASVAVAVWSLALLGCDETRLRGPQGVVATKPPTDEAVLVAKAPSDEAADGENVSNEEATSSADGSDWPIFLGPQGTGVSDETGLLDEWPTAGPALLWEQRIGKGYSSPSIRGDRL
ncbi:MAG: hypothetical protein H7062_21370, partial [Candidatus Saccharimonas sp.]|nr:hypothetical protein [Planctomycetaceae bacterium]